MVLTSSPGQPCVDHLDENDHDAGGDHRGDFVEDEHHGLIMGPNAHQQTWSVVTLVMISLMALIMILVVINVMTLMKVNTMV